MDYKQNPDVLLETLNTDGALRGKGVLDVGCGTGHLSRLMAEHGARVIGIECNRTQLDKARAADPVADETFVEGIAEEMPAADASIDIVVFANSLHHVPIGGQAKALQETARVLRPGGLVYVSEPLAEGTFFTLMRPVHDETRVRAHAYQAIQGAGAFGLSQVDERVHCHTVRQADYESFRARITTINPDTEAGFDAHDADLRVAFRRLGRPDGADTLFEQPTRINLLKKG